MAHFAGDESMPPDQKALIGVLGSYSADLAGIATILWTDLPVKDNEEVITFHH
jgi:hypothetical protein